MAPTTITMTTIQLQRLEVLSQLNGGQIDGTEASEKLGLTVRHIRRLKQRVKKEGAAGLLHGNRGKKSPHAIKASIRKKVLKLVRTTYRGFGPTFAGEKLAERDAIAVSHEWLRSLMITEGLWTPKTRGKATTHHAWRPRMDLRGAMEQFDGSYHRWVEGLNEELCLLLSIDDATGTITKACFDTNEGVTPVFTFWKEYAEETGTLPKRLYVDKFSTYKVNHQSATDEPSMVTQFNRALGELGVELICAHSPQAKGRVERVFGTLQDRLVKEMTLAGIRTLKEANAFLIGYIPKFNERFGVVPAKAGDAYVTVLSTHNLSAIFSVQDERRVGNDFTVRFQGSWYQIAKEQSVTVLPRDIVLVEQRLDDTVAMRLMRRDAYLSITKLPLRPPKTHSPVMIAATTRTPHIPPATHPWRKYPQRITKSAISVS